MNEIWAIATKELRQLVRDKAAAFWVLGFPLRILPPLIDPLIAKLFRYPDFSVTLVAYKPRFSG